MRGRISVDVVLKDDLKNGIIANPSAVVERVMTFLEGDADVEEIDGAEWAQA